MRRVMYLAVALGPATLLGSGCMQAGYGGPPSEAHPAALQSRQADRWQADLGRNLPAALAGSEAPPPGPPTTPPSSGTPAVDVPDWGVRAAELVEKRVIVYTAEYHVAVANTQAAQGEAEKLAAELNGYVQSITEDRVVLRIPADKFSAATARVERMGQLVSRQIQAQDITEEYVDLRMRLSSSQAMLKRLEALLEKAPDAKQALEVEREIARVMTEIERLQGRIRLLETQAALSTVAIQFHRLSEAPRPALLGRKLPFDWLHTLGVNALLDY